MAQSIKVLRVPSQDRRPNIGFSGVVCCEREFPIAKLCVQIVKVTRRGIRSFEEVEAIIANLVHMQSVAAGRIGHELPKTARAFRRERINASAAFDKDYRSQFGGDATISKDGIDGGT